ncbi:MAG: hypothetical protein NTX06_01570, partial [Proteobacteria bacterium]|nr:hypothetical protein [Pseudomonadota bacterium]
EKSTAKTKISPFGRDDTGVKKRVSVQPLMNRQILAQLANQLTKKMHCDIFLYKEFPSPPSADR